MHGKQAHVKPRYTVLSSFKYAFEGIVTAFREGHNIRIQSVLAVVAIVLGFVLEISAAEWIVIIFCMGAVLAGECFNTSFEDVVDLACPEYHPLAKAAKDLAAGGVLAFSIASLLIGIIIYGSHLLPLLGFQG